MDDLIREMLEHPGYTKRVNSKKHTQEKKIKNEIFVITNENWGLTNINDCGETKYIIYDDLSVSVIKTYINNINVRIDNLHITDEQFKKIEKNMENIDLIDEDVVACDGDAWEFIYYKNNTIYKKREMDYIYGIKELEAITETLKEIPYLLYIH